VPTIVRAMKAATRDDRRRPTNFDGAVVARRATHAISEYVTETAALMATISPKRENGRKMAWVSGRDAATVVKALLTTDEPM